MTVFSIFVKRVASAFSLSEISVSTFFDTRLINDSRSVSASFLA
jgi:hypothetical protein